MGFVLLFGGCLLLAIVFTDISSPTYMCWVGHVKSLPSGEMIAKSAAIESLRSFQLEVNWIVRDRIVFPTVAMLAGGLLLAFGRRRGKQDQNQAAQATAPKVADPGR